MKRREWLWRWGWVLGAALILGTGQTCTSGPGGVGGQPDNPGSVYRIRPFDRLMITSATRELSVAEMSVADDGTITMPHVKKIRVAGLTKSQAEEALYNAYVPKYFTDVRINIEITSLIYYIYGEVKVPGQKQWIKDTTLMQAIISASGFTDYAKRNVEVVRTLTGEDGKEIIKTYKFNCSKIEKGQAVDPPIFPNDKILVRRKVL